MKVILEKVFRKDQETKFGNRKSVSLKVTNKVLETETGDKIDNSENKWLSFLHKEGEFKNLDGWTEGMEVDIKIKQNGAYINFEPTDEIVLRVEALEKAVFGGKSETKSEEPEDVIDL